MPLPGIYERWWVAMSGQASPVESRSTCHACAMAPGAANLPPEGAFSPDLMCCTYHPYLSAHLVGGILRDGTAAGKAKIAARLVARDGVTPIGISPTVEYNAHHARLADKPGSFGHREELRCPYLDDRQCSIWQHRGVACSAFHCKYDRGVFGHWRWGMIVVAFNTLDRVLNTWQLARMGLSSASCDALLHEPLDEARYVAAWGAYVGREHDYFKEVATLVEALTWNEILEISGTGLDKMAESLRQALARIDDIPPTVKRGRDVLVQLGADRSARVHNRTISLDVLDVPGDAMDAIDQLSSAGTDTATLNLSAEMLRRILDWQLVVAGG